MKQSYFLTFLLVLGVQMLICNYLHISAFLTLSILPCAIMLLPTKCRPVEAMLIAFASGLAIDYLADGVIGLNALALVPVALSRRGVCRLVFGSELLANVEDVSMMKYGISKMTIAIFIVQCLFMAIYIWADGAGTRPFLFNLARFLISVIAGTGISLIIADILDPNDRK